MGIVDPSRLLTPVSAERPCGDDLEYDGAFLELHQACAGKPERRMGDEVIAGEEPNWRTVQQLAQQLLGRTKDLRVAVPLCRAWLHTDGFAGLAQGLAVVRGLLEQHWQGLFPRLDADDHDDPTMRVNVMLGLCDTAGMLRSLREVPVVQARMAGSFGLRDLEVAAGKLPPPPGAKPPSQELIRAAFQEVAPEALVAQAGAVQEAKEHLRAIAALLDGRIGGRAPDLRPMANALELVAQELQKQLQQRGVTAPGAAAPAAASNGSTGSTSGGAATGGNMQIQTREDVIACLERICEFYRRTEPSSPVPILLRRASSLVNKSFLDVIKNLVPEALPQAEAFRGPEGPEP
jgi:type VI secretion system protein ImpA